MLFVRKLRHNAFCNLYFCLGEKYKNLGKQCWSRCGAKQGRCSYCGIEGLCCRKRWTGNGCNGQMGGGSHHICVEKATTTTMESISPSTTVESTTPTSINSQVMSTIMPLPPGDEPKVLFWRTFVTMNMTTKIMNKNYEGKGGDGDLSRMCLDKCKTNCTSDRDHKCFGKVHHSKLTHLLFRIFNEIEIF